MMTLFNILRPIKFDKVILWAMVLCVSSILSVTDVLAELSEPSFYKKEHIVKSPNGSTNIRNSHSYKKQNIKYLTDAMLGNASADEVAAIIKKYPNLMEYIGQSGSIEFEVRDELEDLYDDEEITEAQYKESRKKLGLAYDQAYFLCLQATMFTKQSQEEIEKMDKSTLTKNPCYTDGYNRILKDKKDGIITEEEAKKRQESLIKEGLEKKEVVHIDKLSDVGDYNEKKMKRMAGIESNKECDIQGMRENYQSSCYSCMVIKTLITTFMDAASNVQDVTTDAGTKILQLGLMIWLAFFVLKNVTSLTNVEPGSMINTLFTMLFKCFVAYVFITSGITAFMMYIIEPIMEFGAKYGIALMNGSPAHLELTPSSGNVYGGTKIVSASLINNIMGFTESLDKTVSTNLIIGHSLTCHATHAGMWVWEALGFEIKIPNFWIWLCGAAIWFCGFMLTLGIGYYMLDISFKLGFAIIAFPIVAALWPFNITKDKFKKCVSIIMKSAATFAMLALTASYALALISESLRDLDEFFKRVEAGDSEWISNTFDITGSYFIIIMFAYLYSMKLIASTIPDYVNKFFPDGVFKSDPMHQKLTQVTDMAKKAAVGTASLAGGVVTHQAGKLVDKGLQKGVRGIRSVYNKFKKNDDGEDKKSGGVSGGVKNAGTATKNTGKAMEQTGKATEQTGKAVEQGGKAVGKGGDAMMKGGKALSATGLGAIVGVPMMIAGGAVKAAGVATEYAGKATAKAGQVIKKSGKALKKTGEKMEQAGEKMQKVGKGLKDKGDNMGKKKEDKPEDSENPDKQQ